MFTLRYQTGPAWAEAVLGDVNSFLSDHAHAERKVVGSALQLANHFPEHADIVEAMIDLAREELSHFRQVHDLLRSRGVALARDLPDPYMKPLVALLRRGQHPEYLLDRLVVFSVVEARGCERFELITRALPPGPVQVFYARLSEAERRHQGLFLELAHGHFDADTVEERLNDVLDAEAAVVAALPIRPALH